VQRRQKLISRKARCSNVPFGDVAMAAKHTANDVRCMAVVNMNVSRGYGAQVGATYGATSRLTGHQRGKGISIQAKSAFPYASGVLGTPGGIALDFLPLVALVLLPSFALLVGGPLGLNLGLHIVSQPASLGFFGLIVGFISLNHLFSIALVILSAVLATALFLLFGELGVLRQDGLLKKQTTCNVTLYGDQP